MNIELLRKVQAHIKEEPKRLNMDMWLITRDSAHSAGYQLDFPPCGTVGCIKGWANFLSGRHRHDLIIGKDDLGLNYEQSKRLFFVEHWPEVFKKLYRLANTPEDRVAVTCQYIDYFIKDENSILTRIKRWWKAL